LVAKGGRFAELARAQFMVQESSKESIQASSQENVKQSVPQNAPGVQAPSADSAAVKI
jgi:hypothetical protein